MKRFLISVMTLSLVLICPVCAEETEMEIETDIDEEFDKGTRMNPYNFGDDMNIVVHTVDEMDQPTWIELTIKFDEVLDAETLEELYPDNSSIQDRFVLKGTITTGQASTDDESVEFELEADLVTPDLRTEKWSYIEDYTDAKTIYDGYSYMTYDVIVECHTDDLSEADGAYLRIGYYANEGDLDYEEDIYNQSFIWMQLP